MDWFDTWQDVPPISLRAWARVIVVFALFLAARDHNAPYDLDPFALAVGLDFVIRLLQGLTSRMAFFDGKPDSYLILSGFIIAGLTAAGWIACQTSFIALIAATAWISLSTAAQLTLSFMPAEIEVSNSVWHSTGENAPFALRFEAACDVVASCASLAIFWALGPMIALAFMTFGRLVVLFFVRWTIYLIIRARYLQ